LLQFDSTLASHVFAVDRRREGRTDVAMPTHIMLPGRKLVPIRVENISEGGVFARLEEALIERTKVRIDLPGIGWVPGQIVWSMHDGHGFAFDEPIPAHTVDVLTFIYRQSD
jgi:hypothetical protein